MAQRPAAPTLSASPYGPEAVRIEFDVPTDGAPSHAMVCVRDDATGGTHMYDAWTQKLLPVGEMGKLETLEENGRTPRRKRLSVAGLGAGKFTATVAFRAADEVDFGPTSPDSAPLVRTPAPACGAPMLEPVSETEIRVHLAVPPGCSIARIFFCENEAPARRFVDKNTRTLTAQGDVHNGTIFPVTGDETIVVKNLSSEISYTVEVSAHNGIGWGPCSPASKPMQIANYKPQAPGEPVLDQISPDSVRVTCALLPNCTVATIMFKNLGTGDKLIVDSASGNRLFRYEHGRKASRRADCYNGVVVPGLSPDTEYEVCYMQANRFGWSALSPVTPRVRFRTLSDPLSVRPVVVPARGGVPAAPAVPPPAAPAPADGRKRAVDADETDDDAPPPASRPIKREKKRQEHGYGLDEFCVADGDEDDDASEELAKRRRRTVSESSEDDL